MSPANLVRRDFIKAAAAAAAGASMPSFAVNLSASRRDEATQDKLISEWDRHTEEVTPDVYEQYLKDGDTRGYKTLELLEQAFETVMREVKETVVDGETPAVWSVYNMGYIVKTARSVFSIDLVHRRESEFVNMIDFALITHNHSDHWRQGFANAVIASGKPVVSNFLGCKGYTRAKKVFEFKDVEVRTSLIDHNANLIDFTTAFEIRVGNWTLYHTGDSGKGTEPKLETKWGAPDLWLFFPGCGINTVEAVKKVKAKRIVIGHLWELAHKGNHMGRLDGLLVRRRLVEAKEAGCKDVAIALWGERII